MSNVKPSSWTLENDEEGWQGGYGQSCNQFENWLIRDENTDNRDVVAIIPKVGDEEYDNEVTYTNAVMATQAPQLYKACCAAHNWLREYHTHMGSPMDEGVLGLFDQLEEAMRPINHMPERKP